MIGDDTGNLYKWDIRTNQAQLLSTVLIFNLNVKK